MIYPPYIFLMNSFFKYIIAAAAILPTLGGMAQQRDAILNVQVTSVAGDDLNGQTLTVTQTDFQVSYGTVKLDAEGKCSMKIYAGNHEVALTRPGFNPLTESFTATSGETVNLQLQLTEATRDPYALTADVDHDWVSGKDNVNLTWNTEPPALFDDFESYEDFAISFGDWTGIDGDGETTAPIVGVYPNRGGLQYAQIINPLTVMPTWWYDYPVLRPYSGQQYVGFIRTSSGVANDDWLISPEITVGVDNELSFMAKAADAYPERFMVYVTTKTDNPGVDDFVRIDSGNFESVDYTEWRKFSYDLSQWQGEKIKFAIRYISDAARFGAFMLMVDDVYVGQPQTEQAKAKARRVMRSPGNVNERFEIYLDGEKAGETDTYSFTLENLTPGQHTIGVRAIYLNAQSEVTTINVETGAGPYAALTLNVSALSKLSPEGFDVVLMDHANASQSIQKVKNGQIIWNSLPLGKYDVSIEEGAFNAYLNTIEVSKEMTLAIEMTDRMIAPYNITADLDDKGNASIIWNRELSFADSFEDYDDFASGSFGNWLIIDRDRQPVYPIGLGSTSNVVSFPGSGTATNPAATPAMVFNPWRTTPAMMPSDPRIAALTGDKLITFFSTQGGKSDDWLISPELNIRDNFEVSFAAQAYSTAYPESMEVCISDGSTDPADFTPIATIDKLGDWASYKVDLSAYAGQTVRIAIHYTSYDAFMAQVDDFMVGNADGDTQVIDYGNVVNYEVYLDGQLAGSPEEPRIVVPGVGEGQHTVDIYAVYKGGRSEKGSHTFGKSGLTEAIDETDADSEATYYDLYGREVKNPTAKGIYIRKDKRGATKQIR